MMDGKHLEMPNLPDDMSKRIQALCSSRNTQDLGLTRYTDVSGGDIGHMLCISLAKVK